MKFSLYLLVCLLCTIANSGYATIMKCSIATQEQCNETIFVDSSQIHFSDHEILVRLNQDMLPVTSLCGDYQGIFMEYECGAGYWVCPKCKGVNELWTWPYCNHCPYVGPRVTLR